jgi:cation:H+ antiporter
VVSAVKVASAIGLSQRVIALTIVSIGTSLPELATSVIAARKKSVDIAIGNIVGSNIFNVFFILGMSAVIHPVSLQPFSNIDMALNIFASLLLFLFIFTGKGRRIGKREGVFFVLTYVTYIGFLIIA